MNSETMNLPKIKEKEINKYIKKSVGRLLLATMIATSGYLAVEMQQRKTGEDKVPEGKNDKQIESEMVERLTFSEYFPSINEHPAVVDSSEDVLITRRANLIVGETKLVEEPMLLVNDPEGEPYNIDYLVVTESTYKDDSGQDQKINIILMVGLSNGTTISPDMLNGLIPDGGLYRGEPNFYSDAPGKLVEEMNQHRGEQITFFTLVGVAGQPVGRYGDKNYEPQFDFLTGVSDMAARDVLKFETRGHVPPSDDFYLWAFKVDLDI